MYLRFQDLAPSSQSMNQLNLLYLRLNDVLERYMSKIRLPANIENLTKLIRVVSDFAKRKGFTQKRIREIELATEEALVNIISYAYPDENTGEVEIRCKMANNTELIIEILDTGVPFDIESYSEPELTANLADRHIGGLGIFLIRKMVDEFHYCRDGKSNILTLVIHKTA